MQPLGTPELPGGADADLGGSVILTLRKGTRSRCVFSALQVDVYIDSFILCLVYKETALETELGEGAHVLSCLNLRLCEEE